MRKPFAPAVLTALMIACLVCASCAKKESADAAPSAQVAEDTLMPPGTVTFLFGNATMTVGGNGVPLDIGTKVPVDATVSTDADAICEIQFGDFGSIHIDSASTLTLNKFMADATHTESEITLNAGKVVCKVRKLAGDDSFQVRTPEMICGVRGTVFQVARDDAKAVKIAVKEGSVAVYPPSVDTTATLPDAVSNAIRVYAPVVAAGEEAAIEPEAIRALDVAFAKLTGSADAESAESIEDYKELSASIVTERAPISADSEKIFNDASTLTLDNAATRQETDAMATTSDTTAPTEANARATPEPTARQTAAKPNEQKKQKIISRMISVSQAKLVAVCPAGDGGYFASDAKSVVTAIGADGKILWSAQTGNATNALNPPVTGGGVVAFAGDKNLAVFDAVTGKQLWALALDKTNTGLYGRHPAIAKRMLFLAGDSGIVVYEAKTGVKAGTIMFMNGSDMSPLHANGKIHIVSKSGAWHKINADTLTILRTLETGASQPVASAPAVSGTTVVFTDRKGTVTALDLESGALLWQEKLDKTKAVDAFADPVIAAGCVYVYAKGTLYGLDLATGKPMFAPLAGATSAPCFAGGLVWYGEGKSLVALSPADGSVAKKIAIAGTVSGTPIPASPVPSDGSAIIVPLASGKLFVQPLE